MSPQDRRHGREAARRRAAQTAARELARRRRRHLRVSVAGVIGVMVLLAVILANVSGDDSKSASATSTTTTASITTTTIAERLIPDDPSENASPAFVYGTGACPPDSKPATPKRTFDAAPKRCLADGVDYKATVATNLGSFNIDLLEHRAPGTVNNFVVLAKWGYFDGLRFHRVVKGFVNQAGDPKGDGSGGPGYEIADELPPSVQSYAKWAVAMANPGRPNSNGSQWFTCLDCSSLPTPGYSLFGQVIDGTDVVQKINDLSTGDGPPSSPVTISSVTILEG